MLLKASLENINTACRLLCAGKLVALPTETVYGLAADAFNAAAVQRIFTVKRRPSQDPLIVHIADYTQINKVALLDDARSSARLEKLKVLWPGPLSIILKRNPLLPASVSSGLDTVALRVPAHPVMRQVLQISGLALACPSANPFSYVSPTCAQHVQDQLGDKIEMVLDGGECQIGIESSVLSIANSQVQLLRPGAVSLEHIEEVLGEKVQAAQNVKLEANTQLKPMTAPGMLDKHYAPRTALAFRSTAQDAQLPARVGLIAFAPVLSEKELAKYECIRVLSENASLEEIAHKLFAAIRDLDQMGLDLILVDSCPEQGLGLAIMDRLRRACCRV